MSPTSSQFSQGLTWSLPARTTPGWASWGRWGITKSNVTFAPPVHPSYGITLHLNDATFSNAASHPCF
ncbi:hypothetical protein D0864_13433 [Hortaea werneckii]|uniref:Uncharacterized protein n=1 Tax=Hortaea werneckii TaxID=91943 RepID=A0A3M7D1W5_HORWE|nr:hypothetical protein D0864_13433 [Hortaea werneckii]